MKLLEEVGTFLAKHYAPLLNCRSSVRSSIIVLLEEPQTRQRQTYSCHLIRSMLIQVFLWNRNMLIDRSEVVDLNVDAWRIKSIFGFEMGK
jgi:hypothetical protein